MIKKDFDRTVTVKDLANAAKAFQGFAILSQAAQERFPDGLTWSDFGQKLLEIAAGLADQSGVTSLALAASGLFETDLREVYTLDDTWRRFLQINAVGLAWFGCTAEEAIGRLGSADFLTEAGRAVFREQFERFGRKPWRNHPIRHLAPQQLRRRQINLVAQRRPITK